MNSTWLIPAALVLGFAWAISNPQPRLRQQQHRIGLNLSPWMVLMSAMGAGAVFWNSPTLGFAAPSAVICARVAAGRIDSRAKRQRMLAALPAFTDELAQQLRSGGSLSASLVRVASDSPQISPILKPALDGLAAGERLEKAVLRIDQSDEAVRLVLVTISLLINVGGPAAQTIERMGESVRALIAGEEEAKALAGQGTASAVVLAGIPVVFASLAAASDPELARFYAFEWAGAACVTASVVLTGVSWFWMDGLLWGKK